MEFLAELLRVVSNPQPRWCSQQGLSAVLRHHHRRPVERHPEDGSMAPMPLLDAAGVPEVLSPIPLLA